MNVRDKAPTASYGILERNKAGTEIDEVIEQVQNVGYAVLNSGLSEDALNTLRREFDRTREYYIELFGADRLKSLDEYYTVRSPMTYGDHSFLELVMNDNLMTVLEGLIKGKFILNQQNCLINPPCENYNQGAWHRDLPYQHFTSSSPLAVNALFCIDDFTLKNGATYVLPASHKSEVFPSDRYVEKNAIQIEAKAGSFIVLDCMMFHSGGFNSTSIARRAINHVFTIPYFKQQINIPLSLGGEDLPDRVRDILGFNYQEPHSVAAYLATRK